MNKHYRTFKIKYLPCTNFKPSRVSIKDLRHGKSVILSGNGGQAHEVAQEYLKKRGIKVIGFSCCDFANFDLVFSNDFATQIK